MILKDKTHADKTWTRAWLKKHRFRIAAASLGLLTAFNLSSINKPITAPIRLNWDKASAEVMTPAKVKDISERLDKTGLLDYTKLALDSQVTVSCYYGKKYTEYNDFGKRSYQPNHMLPPQLEQIYNHIRVVQVNHTDDNGDPAYRDKAVVLEDMGPVAPVTFGVYAWLSLQSKDCLVDFYVTPERLKKIDTILPPLKPGS